MNTTQTQSADLGGEAVAGEGEVQNNEASVDQGTQESSGVLDTEAALAKAREKLDASRGDEESSAASGEQAADPDKRGGESTRGKEGEEVGKEGEEATSAADSDQSASTAAAPEHWPQAQREMFNALPSDEARSLVLDISKDLQGGFTQAMQQVAELKKGHEALHQTIETHGVNDQTVIDLMGTASRFEKDPKAVISELAAQKGIEIFFERPLPEGEIPEFENQADLVKWIDERNAERTKKALAEQQKQEREEAAREQATTALRNEISDFASKTPDFVKHKETVIEQLAMAPGLSVEEAYALKVELPAMRAELETARQAVKDLAALKADIEKQDKASTTLPDGERGVSREVKDTSGLSETEAALKRAQRKLAAA